MKVNNIPWAFNVMGWNFPESTDSSCHFDTRLMKEDSGGGIGKPIFAG